MPTMGLSVGSTSTFTHVRAHVLDEYSSSDQMSVGYLMQSNVNWSSTWGAT